MKLLKKPSREEWPAIMQRPLLDDAELTKKVSTILTAVRTGRDEALRAYARQFDGVEIADIQVSQAEIEEAARLLPGSLREAIAVARENIGRFHAAQQESPEVVTPAPGIRCWRKSVAIEKVGLYIPGGSAPLFSTLLMLGTPALLAGCRTIAVCSPPGPDGRLHPAVLYTAGLLGLRQVYKVGGAQAIAAMAYGTETIPQVYKIFGPGNQYVTKAKELIQQQGVAIDMPAGPSEVLIIADETANPDYLAADLLSQAEHGADSQVILLSNHMPVLQAALRALDNQLNQLPRQSLARQALQKSYAICFDNLQECLQFSNRYAPEHLILALDEAEIYADEVINAGSVFVGHYSCESAGDYATGTNHTLPTNGWAKSYSGVALDSFVKKITFQQLSRQGLRAIGNTVTVMAEAEQLQAHKNAVTIRLNNTSND